MAERAHRPVIAHVSGPNATIQNTPPLVTSRKARVRHGLAADGRGFDALRPQRLAAKTKVYVEQFSAHPMEEDRADLYGPPDGYIAEDGTFTRDRPDASARPVYEIELEPADGLYPLPYMALQRDGSPWEEDCATGRIDEGGARQSFYPDGSRSFEEIDRLGVGADGRSNVLGRIADFRFHRLAPPAGYTRRGRRRDLNDEAVAERRGEHFFPYSPRHLAVTPPRGTLAAITNGMQAIAGSSDCDGILWTQGSPQVEETAYWFNLLIDTAKPICAVSAQRPHGQLSADGPHNILDAARYIASGAWRDAGGADRCGVVVIQEQRIFSSRDVVKIDARPGGYATSGSGVLGQVDHLGRPFIEFVPTRRHTLTSHLNLSALPADVPFPGGRSRRIKDESGALLPGAIPLVSIVKDGAFSSLGADPADEADLRASIDHKMGSGLLAGLVVEGLTPYGHSASTTRQQLLLEAAFSGLAVCRVGRGATEGYADPNPHLVAGCNLNSIKARLLLMACLMKLGAPPRAQEPSSPTAAEKDRVIDYVATMQALFDQH